MIFAKAKGGERELTTLKIKVNTVTPLWTGNASGTCKRIQPQSVMGSLRFWFEVICYASSKIDVKSYQAEKVDYNKFKSGVYNILSSAERNNEVGMSLFEIKQRSLEELKVSLPSQIFGCNGWCGFVKIKKLEYSIHSFLNDQLELPKYILKESIERQKPSKWYYEKPYFWGDFCLYLELESDELKKTIIYPLLHFIEIYGFIGGKNNLGYGRVKFEVEDENLEIYNSFKIKGYPEINCSEIVKENIANFKDLLEDSLIENRQIGLYIMGRSKDTDYKKISEKLVKYKSDMRSAVDDKEKRHYIFGSTKRDKYQNIEGPNATKIIPWINKTANNSYQYGFISLILLQKFLSGVSR